MVYNMQVANLRFYLEICLLSKMTPIFLLDFLHVTFQVCCMRSKYVLAKISSRNDVEKGRKCLWRSLRVVLAFSVKHLGKTVQMEKISLWLCKA